MRHTVLLALVALSLALLVGCRKSSGGGTGGGGGSSSWLVGRDGTMLRYDSHTHEVSDYALDAEVDLTDITCRGTAEAWVVGARGTLLRTGDGGDTWEAVELPTDRDLHTVAAAGYLAVWAAGDGVVLRSRDSGASWTIVPAPAVAFTAIATTSSGEVALATTADGDVYRLSAGAERVHDGDVALRSIAFTGDATRAVAVGDGGLVLRSVDGGHAFDALATDVAADLHAVHLTEDGELAIAVGDGGTVLRLDGEIATDEALLADDVALRALHLSATGMGMAVGDRGAALVTHDFAATWQPVDLGVDRDLLGVDDVH